MDYTIKGEVGLHGQGPWSMSYSDGSRSVGFSLIEMMDWLELMPNMSQDDFVIERRIKPELLTEAETLLCEKGIQLDDGRYVRYSIPDAEFRELIDGHWSEPSKEVLWLEMWNNPCWDEWDNRYQDADKLIEEYTPNQLKLFNVLRDCGIRKNIVIGVLKDVDTDQLAVESLERLNDNPTEIIITELLSKAIGIIDEPVV